MLSPSPRAALGRQRRRDACLAFQPYVDDMPLRAINYAFHAVVTIFSILPPQFTFAYFESRRPLRQQAYLRDAAMIHAELPIRRLIFSDFARWRRFAFLITISPLDAHAHIHSWRAIIDVARLISFRFLAQRLAEAPLRAYRWRLLLGHAAQKLAHGFSRRTSFHRTWYISSRFIKHQMPRSHASSLIVRRAGLCSKDGS